jgi:hypothetical protein
MVQCWRFPGIIKPMLRKKWSVIKYVHPVLLLFTQSLLHFTHFRNIAPIVYYTFDPVIGRT